MSETRTRGWRASSCRMNLCFCSYAPAHITTGTSELCRGPRRGNQNHTESGKTISEEQRMETDTCQGLEPAFKLLPGFSGGDGGGRKTCGWRLKEKTRVTFWSQVLQVLALCCRDVPLFPRPVPHFPYAHSAPAVLSRERCLPFSAYFNPICPSPPSGTQLPRQGLFLLPRPSEDDGSRGGWPRVPSPLGPGCWGFP